LPNNQWVIEEIREEIKKFLELNENENTTDQNLWDTAKADQRGMFIAISAYTKSKERSQISDLMLHLKFLEKQEHAKPKQKERNKKINKTETKKKKKPDKESTKQKAGSLKKINKIDKPLANLTKKIKLVKWE
jgi:hypothetical protein